MSTLAGLDHGWLVGAEPQIMDSTAFQQKFGVAPIPIETTLSQTLEWYRGFLATLAKS
ncbi:hypothetical protein [Streptomyces sp. NPDC020607]|uniref:hypothetical protein n=1 Tax=Streptomyces sp. NPDC020607 TaxID=3365082 RepID=UPI0037B3B42C